MLNPPPMSLVVSISTPVLRYFPPRLAESTSWYAMPSAPLSKSSAWLVMTLPVGGGGGGGLPVGVILSQLKLPPEPVEPFVFMHSRRMCWPCDSATFDLVTVL